MSCGVGHRLSLDLILLWLWCRPAATVLLGPLALGISICHRCSPQKTKEKEKKKKKEGAELEEEGEEKNEKREK